MQTREHPLYLMQLALISVSNTGKTAQYVYDVQKNYSDCSIFIKYLNLKSILIKYARFIRLLLFPDHGFV